MKTATITETKNQLSALIDRVRHGETIVITDRGRPVARLVSALTGAAAESLDPKEAAEGEEALGRARRVARGAARGMMKFWDTSALVLLLVPEAVRVSEVSATPGRYAAWHTGRWPPPVWRAMGIASGMMRARARRVSGGACARRSVVRGDAEEGGPS